MSACLMTLTINAAIAVYGADLSTQVDSLNVNDSVCVTRIEQNWMEVHFDVGNVGHTGYLKDYSVKQHAIPSEPIPRDEPYQIAPPPPPTTQQDHSQYNGQQAPDNGFIPRPAALVMQCHPAQSSPYVVVYVNGQAAVIGGKTAHTTKYDVEEVNDNDHNHVFYVKMDRPDQNRTLFLAFDYSKRGRDVSAIRVVSPGSDAKDKCFMDWDDSR